MAGTDTWDAQGVPDLACSESCSYEVGPSLASALGHRLVGGKGSISSFLLYSPTIVFEVLCCPCLHLSRWACYGSPYRSLERRVPVLLERAMAAIPFRCCIIAVFFLSVGVVSILLSPHDG